jgi:hypothetical protein
MSTDFLDGDQPVRIDSKRDAEEAVGGLRQVAKQLKDADKLRGEELTKLGAKVVEIQRAIAESQTRDVGSVGGKDSELRKYVRADGSVQLRSGKVRAEFAGKVHEIEAPGLLDDANRTPAQEDLQRAIERRNLARLVLRPGTSTPHLDAEVARAAMAMPAEIRRVIEPSIRAMYDGSNVGAELIDDGFVPSIYRAFEVPRGLAAAFADVQVSNETFSRPKVTSGARPYKKGDISNDNPAAFTPSTPATDTASFTVPALAVRVLVGEHFAEDSALAAIPYVQEEIRRALEDGYEDCMINGDTAATHQDAIATWNIRSRWGASGLGGSADHRRTFLGLRAKAYDASNTTDQSAAQTAAGFLADMATLSERAVSGLVCVVSPEYLIAKMMDWDEVQTVEKFGPGATILSGQIASVFGVPVVVSRFMSSDLAATGLYTGSSSYTGKLLVDRSAWSHYTRRGAMVEIDKEIKSGHYEIVGSIRRLFASPDAGSTKNVHFAFKLG